MNSYSTSWWSLLLIYRPREDERLSWPCWLTYSGRFTYINDYPSAAGLVQTSESSPVRDRHFTTEPPCCCAYDLQYGTSSHTVYIIHLHHSSLYNPRSKHVLFSNQAFCTLYFADALYKQKYYVLTYRQTDGIATTCTVFAYRRSVKNI